MLRALALTLLAFTSAACDAVAGSDPQPVTLTLGWDVVFVEGDCEFGGGNTGDFEFTVETLSRLSGVRSVVDKTRRNPNSGGASPMNYSNGTFTALGDETDGVEVSFTATEYEGITGNSPDPDMDGRTGSATHTFTGGPWTRLGDQKIRLGSSSDCRVEFRYNASSS